MLIKSQSEAELGLQRLAGFSGNIGKALESSNPAPARANPGEMKMVKD
jgi:hypothetical protein